MATKMPAPRRAGRKAATKATRTMDARARLRARLHSAELDAESLELLGRLVDKLTARSRRLRR